ncbi:MAG: prepilin-type N-terminal cleavage/methylation domain-containing protein [Elusimicrobiota bacterium]|nr:prepilin-type N-terminal cleavage/methylation domain-containing protein [Elusimicrobiota bacterium]
MKIINKNRGVTLIEMALVIALSGVLIYGGLKFFRSTFDIWKGTCNSVDVYSDARSAMDEMSRYIRQSSSEAITIGGSNESVQFTINRSTSDWGNSNREIKYFQPSAQAILRRYMKGSTTTLITEGVDNFHVWYDSETSSRYSFVGATLAVSQGDRSATLSKKIMIRGMRGN